MKEQEIAEQFSEWVRKAMLGAAEGCVPVCVIFLPYEGDGVVDFHGAPRLLWPSALDERERKDLLTWCGEAYAEHLGRTVEEGK